MKKRTNSSAINNPIILLIFFLTTFNGNAQINDLGFSPAADLIPKTPEASSVIKYQDMPVSYYTGVPSVQIPIGGMKQGPLFVNFNLSYHAGGHRPSEVASSVGLGWDLKGHGMITRKVNGTADDNTSPMGFLQMRESYNLDQNDPNNDLDKWIQQEDERMLLNMVNGTWDTQPDEFYFDFNGYSGKMVFDVHNDLPIVSSNAKIRVDSVLGVGKISGWVMTDPNGVRYEFKEYEETAVPSPEAWGTVYTRTAWLLTKMISPYNENDFIEFDYQDYTLKPDHSTYYSKKLYKESSSDKLLPAGTTAQGLCSTNGYAETNFNYNFSTVYGKQLISVSSSEGQKIIFSYLKPREDVNLTSQAPSKYNRLDVITFLNPSQIEKFNLDYYPNTSNLKLQLKSITQVSTTGQTLPPYQFTYHSSVNNNTNSKAVDHWGFYNGSNPNLGLPDYTWVSKMEVNGQTVTHTNFSPGSDMQPNFAAAQTGILKEIQYPTGAITELEYELNDCSYINDKDLASEGLFNYQNESYTCESFGDVSNTNSWVRDTTVFQVLGDSIFAKIQAFGFTDDHWSMKTPQAWIEDKQGNILYTWNIHPQLCLTHPNPQMRPDGTPQPLKIDGPDVLLLNAGTYKLYTKAYHTNSYDDTLIDNIKIQVTFEQPLGADTIMDVGGLRVKRIIKKNKNNIVESTRRFDYSDGQYSSGVIYSLPKYDVVTGHLFEHCIGGVTSLWNFSILCEYYTLTGANRLILSTTSGSHIGYGHVTEYFEENGEFGKIARTYSTPIQYPDEIYKSKPFVPALSQSFKTGLLLKEETYKNENSIFKPIKSVENEYAFKTYEVPLFKAAFGKYPWFDPDATCNNGSIGIEFYYYALPWHQKFVSRHSKLQFGHSQLIKTRVHEIRQSDTLTTTQEFSYCSNLQLLTSESTDNSGGSISVTKLKYPENYNVDENSTNQDSRAIYELSSRNMHPIIEKSSYVKQNGTERILQSSVNKFKSSNGKILLDEVH
ncbi:MAG: hypothetical protein MRY83_08115, partial [Flavobacteriales bacterium]|nr:hypothetical protein [Flavobacteriales bacterium]